MYSTKVAQLQTLQMSTTAPSGFRQTSQILSGFRTHSFRLTARATLTLAGGPATALRNAGSVWGAISNVGLVENGVDRWNVPGLFLRYLSEMVAPQPQPFQRVTAFANGAYTLEESVIIPFAWPLGVTPVETCFVERNPRQASFVFAVLNPAGTQLVATPGTAVFTNVTISVEQIYDDLLAIKPLFVPTARMVQQQITGASTNLDFFLRTTERLRAVIIGQQTDIGDVEDIISAAALRGDFRDIIGPGQVTWDDLVKGWATYLYGGGIRNFGFSATAAQPTTDTYLGLNFQEAGRLGNTLDPNTDVNLRLNLTAQPSVTGGAATSFVNAMLIELERIPGRTADNVNFGR